MNPVVSPEIQELMETVHYRPAISIILPFEPKMSLKRELNAALKRAAGKVEKELLDNYPMEISQLLTRKLNDIIKGLNFNTHKKSIAIYLSPVFEKVLYLDISVEEKIIVDESFEIRDLVYSKKQLHKYLVLLLSSNVSRIYLGNTDTFVRIVADTPESVNTYANDGPQRVSNFSDPSARREVLMNKFLVHIDNSLDIILNAYRLPLFVIGTEKIAGHFKKLSKHNGSVVEFIHGNYGEASLDELKQMLEPHVANWKKVMQKDILNQLEEAAGKMKLEVGIKDVWREAMSHKGRLLIVEKNYSYAAQRGGQPGVIYKPTEPFNRFSYIKDAVDDIIEKVLESGGDVEFVDKDLLNDYHHIALIKHY